MTERVTILDVPAVDTIAHLDFAPEIPCELKNCQAGNPQADWLARMQVADGCYALRICCEPCRLRLCARWEVRANEQGPWRCLRCKGLVHSLHTLHFTPLHNPNPEGT